VLVERRKTFTSKIWNSETINNIMKIVELLNSLTVPITNEEAEVLVKFDETKTVLKSALDPREQLLANSLVTKDVLYRKKNEDGKISFTKKIR
jgi:hypothetical protein